MHFFSGMIYFLSGYIMEGLPTDNAWVYSYAYNMTYMPFEALIGIAVIVILVFTPTFNRLTDMMRKKD